MSANMLEEVASHVEQFIRGRFQVADDDGHFTHHVNLWEEGYLDSLGVVELIKHVEKKFKIKIPDKALFSPDFTKIHGIAEVVVRCRNTGVNGK